MIAGLVTVAVLYAAALTFLDTGWISPEVFAIVAWSALAVAAGDAVRSRRAYAAEVADRARRGRASPARRPPGARSSRSASASPATSTTSSPTGWR